MRKLIAILLSFLMLTSNIGFTMNTHLCEGIAVENSITIGLADLDCGMNAHKEDCESEKTKEKQIQENPCCKNQHKVLQLDENVEFQVPIETINTDFIVAYFFTFIQSLSFESLGAQIIQAPPLLAKHIKIQVLFQTFLI